MKFHSAVIIVKDIERTKKFYCDLMDQTIKYDFGKNVTFESGFAIWELRDENIIKRKLNTLECGNPLELYFEDENIEVIYKKLKEKNVKFLHDIQEEPWGQRTVRFFDPDGHLLEVGEPLHTFVRNLYKQDMTIDQIVEKSGISIEHVKEFLVLD